MNRKLLYPIIGSLIAGCASAPPPDIPLVWSQKPEERGQLPVGRVVSIERWYGPPMTERSTTEELLMPLVVIPITLIAAPVILGAHAVGVDLVDEKPNNENGNVYRHVVRLNGTNEDIVRNEYWTYKVGDCVAVRSKPVLLVPALPDECE